MSNFSFSFFFAANNKITKMRTEYRTPQQKEIDDLTPIALEWWTSLSFKEQWNVSINSLKCPDALTTIEIVNLYKQDYGTYKG